MHVCLLAREALFLSQSMVNGLSRIIWTFAYQFSFYVGIDLMFICIHIYTHTCIYMHAHGYFLCMVCIESEYTLFCQDLRSATLFAYLLYEVFFSKEKGQRYSMVFIGTCFCFVRDTNPALLRRLLLLGQNFCVNMNIYMRKKIYINARMLTSPFTRRGVDSLFFFNENE